MLAIMMTGGMGRRMASGDEKPMLSVGGKPMAARVLDALNDSSCFEHVLAIVSSNAPRTASFLESSGARIVQSSGTNYVSDLNMALQMVKPADAFIVPCDLPLLDGATIQRIIGHYGKCEKPCLTVVVNKSLLDKLGVSADYCSEYEGRTVCNSGISIIDSSRVSGYDAIEEELLLMDELQIALNVNTMRTLEVAEDILSKMARPDPAA